MSDANLNQDPFNKPPVVGTEDRIPHSKEPVRREFDNTDLGDAHNPDAPDFSVPASPALTQAEKELGLDLPATDKTADTTNPEPKKSRRGLAIATTAAAGLAGIAGTLVMTGGSEGESRSNEAPAATAEPFDNTPVATNPGAPVVVETPSNTVDVEAAPAPTTTDSREIAPAPTAAQQTPQTTVAPTTPEVVSENNTYGNIGIADMPLGEDPITAVRHNGEEIQVPRLDASTPQKFGETAMALVACYMTTGSEECLNEFSQREEVQQILKGWRQDNINPNSPNVQLAMWDLPENPAVFEAGETDLGTPIIEMTSGDIRVKRASNNLSTDNSWQGEWTRRNGQGELVISPIRFMLDRNDPTKIEGVIWDWLPVNY